MHTLAEIETRDGTRSAYDAPTGSTVLLSPAAYHYVVDGYRQMLPVHPGIEKHLRGVVEDTLEHPGSLLRAQLAYTLMVQHHVEPESARAVAIAIEYFHTASLILDDMPCMDDSRERRGRLCPHIAFGEDAAVLGALALTNHSYGLLWGVLGRLPPERSLAASRLVMDCLGLNGILNGQAHDLHFADTGMKENDVLRAAYGKTVTLIRLTLVLPAIVAGMPVEIQGRLERLSELWGLSYQIMDDFKDCLMSREQTGKTTARDRELNRPNLPHAIGYERAMGKLHTFMDEAGSVIADIAESFPGWTPLARLHTILQAENQKLVGRLSMVATA